MATAFRNVVSVNSSATTVLNLAPGFPTGMAVGDLLMLLVNLGTGSAVTDTPSGPATKVLNTQQATSNNCRIDSWYDPFVYTGDSSGAATKATFSAARTACAMGVAFSGSNLDSAVSGTPNTATTTATLPGVTPPVDNCLLVGIIAATCNTTNTAFTVGAITNWTSRAGTQTTGTSNRNALNLFTRQLGAGTAGVATASASSTLSVASSVLTAVAILRPAQKIYNYDGAAWNMQRVDQYNGSIWVPQAVNAY